MADEQKPKLCGWKTSEFWLAIMGIAFVVVDLFEQDPSTWSTFWGGFIVVAYVLSRTIIKVAGFYLSRPRN